MTHWPWWVSGLALAGVMLFHWLTLHRMMAVSGRFTALVDRIRSGAPAPTTEMSPEEMLRAIQEATGEEFGADALAHDSPPADVSEMANVNPPLIAAPSSLGLHLLFLGGLIAGGFVATALFGSFAPTASLNSEGFTSLFGSSPLVSSATLVLGGMLVGFGTRMAGGCTSGHGMCGTSRFQPGSLLSTLCFFAAGTATSFLLGMFL
jgi:hypothetical protein